ncbi:MAG: aminotransferase class V-fold PLP-dependent enzyme [Bacteroidota bacterium]
MKCQRDKFQLQNKYTYLNCAYMSPLSKKVEKAGVRGIKGKRKPWKTKAADFFRDSETVRSLFAEIIDCPEPNRIVTVPSVSYGMANVARNLPRSSGEILIVDEQFPSNAYPWLSLRNDPIKVTVVKRPQRGESWTQQIIEHMSKDTIMLAIGNVHWADGTLFDLKALRKATRDHGAILVIDGTQSVGALPISVREVEPDALVCAGYKWLFGPYSTGYAYYGPTFDQGTPVEENWINRKGAEHFGGLVTYTDEYAPGALRYEVGEHSNFVMMPMMIAALKQVRNWDPGEIQAYCRELTEPLIDAAIDMGFYVAPQAQRAHHLLGLYMPDQLPVATVEKQLHQNRINVSVRGHAMRISPNVYNDQRDIDKLIKTLKEAVDKSVVVA